tara:strand:+ start:265 stop:453 length:189 start_codon:yes stop_codon:yes gene_type:complete
MKVGDLVRCMPESRVGIIIDWHIIYNRYGEAVERMAVVQWDSSPVFEHEYTDMLEVINELVS